MNAYHQALVAAILLTGCSATQIGAAIDSAAVNVAGGANSYSDNDISVSVPAGYVITRTPAQNQPDIVFTAQNAANDKRIAFKVADVSKIAPPAPEAMTTAFATSIMNSVIDDLAGSGGASVQVVRPVGSALVGKQLAYGSAITYLLGEHRVSALLGVVYKKPLACIVMNVDASGVGDPSVMETVIGSLNFKH